MRPWTVILIVAAFLGCDSRIERFEPNEVFALTLAKTRSTPTEAAMDDASVALDSLFGTPDRPEWPADPSDGGDLVDPEALVRAGGPVSSEKDGTHLGLFREHCVTCHGLEGGGAGPASVFQNPYPRDFRHGIFKWKSTQRNAKPTREDLRQLLRHGVPGTGMPSFSLLSDEDLESLVDYVIYLSARGETERRLVAAAIDELDYSDTPPDDSLRLNALGDGDTEGAAVVSEVFNRVKESWQAAGDHVVPAPPWNELEGQALTDAIDRGKQLFHGQVANCAGCHGPAGNGQLATLDYDDWTKEYSTRIGLTPADREAMKPFRDAGAPRPRPIKPRNLQNGVFRGGGDADTLYRRITQGIPGTPMPAVELTEEANGKALTPDQVWDLVRYVQSLSDGN